MKSKRHAEKSQNKQNKENITIGVVAERATTPFNIKYYGRSFT